MSQSEYLSDMEPKHYLIRTGVAGALKVSQLVVLNNILLNGISISAKHLPITERQELNL